MVIDFMAKKLVLSFSFPPKKKLGIDINHKMAKQLIPKPGKNVSYKQVGEFDGENQHTSVRLIVALLADSSSLASKKWYCWPHR